MVSTEHVQQPPMSGIAQPDVRWAVTNGVIGGVIGGIVFAIAATVFGFALWIVNFYVLVPLINRPWFKMAPAGQQFVYHTFFFGTVLGLYLMLVLPSVRQSEA